MIEALVSGKLHGKPGVRTSKTGRPFTVAKLRSAAGDGDTLFVNVVAFSETAQAVLLALDDGDAVAMAGSLALKIWTDREGMARPSVDLVADQVLTAYASKRKRAAIEAIAGAVETAKPRQQPHDDGFGAAGGDAWLEERRP